MAGANGRKSKWDIPSSEANGSNEGRGSSSADAARERAAKLNAMLAAKGKLAKGTPPAPLIPAVPIGVSTPAKQSAPSKKDTPASDLDLFTAEVEINDSPSRIMLCKGVTQDQINRYSGAAVSTRGKFYRRGEQPSTSDDGESPLYLCVQGTSQAKVDLAVKRIREIMAGADIYGKFAGSGPPLSSQSPAPSSYHAATAMPSQSLPPGMHYVQEKLFVGLDHAPPDFSLKEKLLGPAGSYLQHIAMETGAKVQLRGRGSGFIEPTSGKEAFEALYIYVSHNKVDGLSAAKKLAESLIQTVHTEFKAFEQANSARTFYGDPFQRGHPPAPYPQVPPYQTPYGYLPPARFQPPPGGYQSAPHYDHYYNQHPPSGPPHGPHQPPVPFGEPPGHTYPNGHGNPPVGIPAYAQYPGHPVYPRPPPPDLPLAHSAQAPPEHKHRSQPMLPVPAPQTAQPSQVRAPEQGASNDRRPPDPPKRRFTEKAPAKSSGVGNPADSRPSEKSSVSPPLGPVLSQGGSSSSSQQNQARLVQPDMPPPPALLPKAKPRDNKAPPVPAAIFAMPPPAAALSSKLHGKRQATQILATGRETKQAKSAKEDEGVSALAPLVAYGDGDSSSDEDEINPPNAKADSTTSRSRGSQGGTLPFWAVKHS